MSSNEPGKDFQLPGLNKGSPLEHRLATAIAGAYSIEFNPRRLESLFYGIWDIILTAMISDLGPNVYFVPQFTLDGHVPQDLASSITDAHANERIPDFVVVADNIKYLSAHASDTIPRWQKITTVSRRYLMLVEGKRPPTHHPKDQQSFERDLGAFLSEAQVDLEAQAAKVFEGHADAERLILVAFSGVWWSWSIYTRAHSDAAENAPDQPREEDPSTPTAEENLDSNVQPRPQGVDFCQGHIGKWQM